MVQTLKQTADGAFRDEFGNTFRPISEGYVCPLENRTKPLGSSASLEDSAGKSKQQTPCGPSYF